MFGLRKSTGARRADIRKNRPDAGQTLTSRLRADGGGLSLLIAGLFCGGAMLILTLREEVVPYQPGQWTRHDIVARVDFTHRDPKRLASAVEAAREREPRIYRPADQDPWKTTEDDLLTLPDRVKGITRLDELPAELQTVLDAGALTRLQEFQANPIPFEQAVRRYIEGIRSIPLIIIPEADYQKDSGKKIRIGDLPDSVAAVTTYTPKMRDEIGLRLSRIAEQNFLSVLQPKVIALTLRHLAPTHEVDAARTTEALNRAVAEIPASVAEVLRTAGTPIVNVDPARGGGEITQEDWVVLKFENDEFQRRLGSASWGQRGGLAGVVLLMTMVVCGYVTRYQPRIVQNHARALAIAVLMLSMLLLAQVAALGSYSIYFFGVAPTILVAMILAIAYDQRFALGMGTFHAVLVTLAIGGDLSFLTILEAGVVTCCFLLDDIRTRSRLIEVGGATAAAMIAATAFAGLVRFDPIPYIGRNCLYAAAAGLSVGFIVLGILPFIEKAFRITTSMTLLELADASHPLLRRLSLEAPGTYNHSLQVASLAEEAAEVIGANSLLCRVASYYHDIGKINKADYFVENQIDGQNRHLNLSPNVSLLIIIGHVKDGVELAREYNLPTSITPFIQQHHGTTLVEFFYHRACDASAPDQPQVSDSQFRYPGPKPQKKEIAILMLADAVESACRAMPEPTASRIETLVNDIASRRLADGQFDECDLTMRELALIERSLVKSLLGIYHGRIAYPSTAGISAPQAQPPASNANIKTA